MQQILVACHHLRIPLTGERFCVEMPDVSLKNAIRIQAYNESDIHNIYMYIYTYNMCIYQSIFINKYIYMYTYINVQSIYLHLSSLGRNCWQIHHTDHTWRVLGNVTTSYTGFVSRC